MTTHPEATLSCIPVFLKFIVPKGNNNVRSLRALKKPFYIVVHNTGNTAKTANAEMHAAYLQTTENQDERYVSWHLTVDSVAATQHIPFDEIAWHAGDGNGLGNTQGIGIEICENENYVQAEKNAVNVICELMRMFEIPLERVLPHRYFATNKKLCPWKILKSETDWQQNWSEFQSRIMAVFKSQAQEDSAANAISKENETLLEALAKKIEIDKDYWGLVLDGKTFANPEYLKIIFERFVKATDLQTLH